VITTNLFRGIVTGDVLEVVLPGAPHDRFSRAIPRYSFFAGSSAGFWPPGAAFCPRSA